MQPAAYALEDIPLICSFGGETWTALNPLGPSHCSHSVATSGQRHSNRCTKAWPPILSSCWLAPAVLQPTIFASGSLVFQREAVHERSVSNLNFNTRLLL